MLYTSAVIQYFGSVHVVMFLSKQVLVDSCFHLGWRAKMMMDYHSVLCLYYKCVAMTNI